MQFGNVIRRTADAVGEEEEGQHTDAAGDGELADEDQEITHAIDDQ